MVDIKSVSENALSIAHMCAMANTAIRGIGANGQVINILRLSLWNLPCDDKGVAGSGGNGDKLILCRINLLLRQIPVELDQEVRVTSKVVGTCDCSKSEALLVHAVSESPQGCWTQLRKVALHHICQEKSRSRLCLLESCSVGGFGVVDCCHGGAAW